MVLRLVLLAPVLLLVILFALSNRQEVALRLWPLDLAWAAPLSVAVLVVAALAFLFGALIAWAAALPARARARRMAEAAGLLEAELAELRARHAREVGPVPPGPGAAPARGGGGGGGGTALVPVRRRAA